MLKINPTIFDPYIEKRLINKQELDGLTIYNYTDHCMYDHAWDDITIMARGLILDKEGNVKALPFTKFFNYGEHGIEQSIPSSPPDNVTIKLDGSLGISYRHPVTNQLRWATRGSFVSEQAKAAQLIWDNKYSHIEVPENWTLLVEIISNETKVIIDYKGINDLYLLGIRNCHTGEDYTYEFIAQWADSVGLHRTRNLPFQSVQDVVDFAKTCTVQKQHEGFVLRWGDFRVKVKAPDYINLAKLLQGITPRRIADMWYENIRPQSIEGLPEEIVTDMLNHYGKYDLEVLEVKKQLDMLAITCATMDRKQIAESYKDHPLFHLLMTYLFAKETDVKLYVYKKHFQSKPRRSTDL